MAILTLVVGPPGSGKSTFARRYCAETGVTYINQDSQGKEHLTLFEVALMAGKDIIVDRMGFSKHQRNRYLDPAKEKGYHTRIKVLHESYAVCFQRVMKRKDHETIKDEQAARGALNTFFTKYERVSDDEADEVTRVWPMGDKPSAIICDLDGTLCNVEHRRHFVRRPVGEKKDWQGFFKGMSADPVYDWCADLLRKMALTNVIVYCSGRPDNWRKETVEWLNKHDLLSINDALGLHIEEYFYLYMRPRSDSRQDNIVKEIILDFEILTRFTPYLMIDDRKQVVDMWRSRGYTCLQCAEGEF